MDMANRASVRQQRSRTAAMAEDVVAMEQRLNELRARMAAARERNEAGRQRNPTGTTWASARTDRPVNSQAYAAQVLASKPPRRQGSAPSRTTPASNPPPPEPLINPLLEPQKEQEPTQPKPSSTSASAAAPRKQRFGAEHHACTSAADEAAMNALAEKFASATSTVTPAAPSSSTRKDLYSWDPTAALAKDDDDEYEDLLGPEPPPPSSGMGTGTDSGSLLDGTYNEAEAAASFAAAVAAWRSSGSTASASPVCTISAGTCTGAEGTAAPTLTQSVTALTTELGLPSGLPLVESVRKANEIVGLEAKGTLTEQVQALIETTGVVVSVPSVGGAGGVVRKPQSFSTQTKPNYLELLNEQKRKDGVL